MERPLTANPQGKVSDPTSRTRWLAAGGVAAATVFGVFVVPFFFPPVHPAMSAAYTSGFNNRVAAAAAGVVAVVTFLLAWRSILGPGAMRAEDRGRMSLRALCAALLSCALFTMALGALLTRAGVAYNDNLYFLEYMDEATRYHLRVYRDFSFLYGPLLLYFPVAFQVLLRPFHVGLQACYYAALTVMQLLGIVLLYFTLEALPLSRRVKTITLALFTLCVLCPLLGLNYTLVRSLLPFSTLLFVSRVRRPLVVAALFFPGELLQLAVSPELGVAFAAGACFYALCRMVTTSRLYLPALVAPLLAVLVFLGITGTVYLTSMSQFSKGCLNLIVEPLPYILFFLFALVWLVPRMLGRMMRQGSADAVAMLSLFVVSMALVPAALGRCDPLHVFFNGAGVYLLAVVAVSGYTEKMRNLWLGGLALVLLWTQAVNTRLYLHPILHAVRVDFFGMAERKNSWFVSFQQIAGHVDHGAVSVPFVIPLSLERELKDAGIYQPDRECFHIGVWDGPAESARVQRMNQTEWAITPTHLVPAVETAENSRRVIGKGLKYQNRKPPYLAGELILMDLAAHWTPAAQNADWVLYHNNRFGEAVLSR